MAHEMAVQLAVTGTFGTDADFDLLVLLEREFASAFRDGTECGRGVIENGHMLVPLTDVADPVEALRAVKDILTRLQVLHRATVVLETRCEADPDDIDRQILWPLAPFAVRSA